MSNTGIARNSQNAHLTPLNTCLFSLGLISLLCVTIAISVCPASAAAEAARWTKVNIPTEGEAGDWALAAGSDIQLLTAGGDGMLFAYVNGPAYTLYRSADGGYRWEYTGGVQDAIVDIAISPQDPAAVYYATASQVYRSVNGGRTFQALPPGPGSSGADHKEITSIDVVRLESNIVAAGTKDTDGAEFGGVYILNEGDIVPAWTDTGLSNGDIAAVAFSPHFSDDRQLIAVATDEVDTFVDTKISDAGWNEDIGRARLDAVAAAAQIAFTGTYNPDEPVYRINGVPAPDNSTATELNAGSADGASGIDIAGLAVGEANGAVVLLAGAADNAMTYVSTDGGATWVRSCKAPTGSVVNQRNGTLFEPNTLS